MPHPTCGGGLHCTTDWDDDAQQMLQLLGDSPALSAGQGLNLPS